MTTIRELLTKWVFKSDTSGVKDAEHAMGRAHLKALGLAGAFKAVSSLSWKLGKSVLSLTEGIAEYSEEIGKAKAKTGFGTEVLQQLRAAATKTEVPFKVLLGGMRKFAISAQGAASGNKAAIASFAALGISVKDNHGKLKSQDELLVEALFRMEAMGESSSRTAMAMKLFGRAGTEMLPMLDEGTLGLSEMMRAARESGKVLGGATLKAGQELDGQLRVLRATTSRFKFELGGALLPIVGKLVTKITDWVKANRGMISQRIPELANRIAEAFTAMLTAAEKHDALGQLSKALGQIMRVVTLMLSHGEAVKWFFIVLAGAGIVGKLAVATKAVWGMVASVWGLVAAKKASTAADVASGGSGLLGKGLVVGAAAGYLAKKAAEGQQGLMLAVLRRKMDNMVKGSDKAGVRKLVDYLESQAGKSSGRGKTMKTLGRFFGTDFDVEAANMLQIAQAGRAGIGAPAAPGVAGATQTANVNVTVNVPPGTDASLANRVGDKAGAVTVKQVRQALAGAR